MPDHNALPYCHQTIDGRDMEIAVGKVVCVGRNYAAHAKELNNPVPSEPILFLKPATSLTALSPSFTIPGNQGECHHETEIALLIDRDLKQASPEEAVAAISHIALALDLTLRDVQSRLKDKGHPWEVAKAFDGAAPISGWVGASTVSDWSDLSFQLRVNGEARQIGHTADMITPIPELLAHMSQHFTLRRGDVVLTGTPAGVAALHENDHLSLSLDGALQVESRCRTK